MLNWSARPLDAGDRAAAAVVVNVASRAALLAEIEDRLAAGRGFTLATLNLDHVVKLRRDPAFRRAYLRQSHVTADGNPIVWLSRLAGRRLELIPGSELVEPVAQLAARRRLPVAFLGASAPVLDAAASLLAGRHPGLSVPVRIAPPMGFDPEGPAADAAIAAIGDAGARLCFVALGAPKQEIFAARAAARLPQVGFLSIGAGLDFLAGAQRRAPGPVRAVAAEWAWRLLSDPRRLGRRYADCLAVLPGLAAEALASRRGRT